MPGRMSAVIDRSAYELVFADDFDGPELDETRWVPHYLPQWTTPDRSAARYELHPGFVRLLGARLVGQHAAVLAVPRPPVLRLAAGLDLLHAATMLPLVGSTRYGRAARISGGVAATYGVWASRA